MLYTYIGFLENVSMTDIRNPNQMTDLASSLNKFLSKSSYTDQLMGAGRNSDISINTSG